MTVLEQFGTWLARGGRRGLSEAVREALRLHLADTVCAWVAGRATPEGRLLAGYGSRTEIGAVLDGVATNCAQARLSEIDDIHLASCTTPGAAIVPAVLGVAASLGIPDRQALAEAIIAGYEAMARLGRAIEGPEALYRGIWPTYFTAPFGVAAATARLLDLSAEQAAHALGLALIRSAPGVGRQSGPAMSRWLALGHAARNGAESAWAAQAGFIADLKLLDGDFFRSVYGISPDSDALMQGLGERPMLLDVAFKPWCAARQTMAAAQGLKEIIESGVEPKDITEAAVFVPPQYFKMVNHGVQPAERSSHLTSLPYQMAVAAFTPAEAYDVTQTPADVPEAVQGLMAKVGVAADEALSRYYPKSWPARLVIGTRSGKHERLVLHVPGDPERPFDEAQVARKFRRFVAPLLGEAAAENLLRRSFEALEMDGGAAELLEHIRR